MRAIKKFSRWKGTHPAGTTLFGGDADPPTGQPDATKDNYFSFPAHSNQGYPTKAMLVLWCSNPGLLAPTTDSIAFKVWIWESLTGTWNRWSAQLAPTVLANVVTTVAVQAPQDPAPSQAYQARATGGSVEGYVVFGSGPIADGDFSDGEYVFALSADMND